MHQRPEGPLQERCACVGTGWGWHDEWRGWRGCPLRLAPLMHLPARLSTHPTAGKYKACESGQACYLSADVNDQSVPTCIWT